MQLAPIRARKKSTWKFNTSGTGGLGLEFVAISGGTVVLEDPSHKIERFHYGAAGGGVSFGIRKIPKIGRIDPARLDSRGISDHFSGNVAPEPSGIVVRFTLWTAVIGMSFSAVTFTAFVLYLTLVPAL